MTVPIPAGFRVEVDSTARQLAPDLLFGGSPARVLRLTSAGQSAWHDLQTGPVTSRTAGLLARRLTDTGLGHPRPPEAASTPDVTIVVPAYERADLLERCLAAERHEYPAVVVDDGSADQAAVAAVAARYGAKLIRRDVNGGPAAARNTALAAVTSELIAFLDSDCVSASDWIERLAGHFADPLVAAVAPRVVGSPRAPGTGLGHYTAECGGLDLGRKPGRVAPGMPVAYVPTAAVLVRRTALMAVARDDQVFDETMSVGEDVDLVWRLHEAGWRVRYDPSVQIVHQEPATWPALLARRYRYGTSAAPLAQRHPGAVSHLVLLPWPAATVTGLLARRPEVAAGAFAASVFTTGQTLRRAAVPRDGLVRAMAGAVRQTWLGLGRYGTQFAAPVLAAAIAAPGGRSPARRWGRRAAAASLLLGPPITAWASSSRTLDPARFTLARIADDIAYGLGVWTGCLSEGTLDPIRPAIARRHLRIDPPEGRV